MKRVDGVKLKVLHRGVVGDLVDVTFEALGAGHGLVLVRLDQLFGPGLGVKGGIVGVYDSALRRG